MLCLDSDLEGHILRSIILTVVVLTIAGCKTTTIERQSVTAYGDGVEIPESARPNEATKQYYIAGQQNWIRSNIRRGRGYEISPSGNAQPFEIQPNPVSEKLTKEFESGSLISYLYYDNGVIKYNGLPVSDRFSVTLDDNYYFFTHSTGKSITSYVLGHAICDGHIRSINEPVDWPVMSETLYQGQPIIDLLNMAAGDAHLVDKNATRWRGHPKHHRDYTLREVAQILNGTEKRGSGVFYNNTLSDLISNYTEYKAGGDYEELIRTIFQDKAKIEKPVYYEQAHRGSYSYWITRKDLLRVAVAMMNDYQDGNCLGQYLRAMQSQKKLWPKYGTAGKRTTNLMNLARYYGGQFYWGFDGMRDRNILGTDGKNGQNILIDLDKSRIVVTHAISAGWDVRELQHRVIKTGRLPK